MTLQYLRIGYDGHAQDILRTFLVPISIFGSFLRFWQSSDQTGPQLHLVEISLSSKPFVNLNASSCDARIGNGTGGLKSCHSSGGISEAYTEWDIHEMTTMRWPLGTSQVSPVMVWSLPGIMQILRVPTLNSHLPDTRPDGDFGNTILKWS